MKFKLKAYSIWEFGQRKDKDGNPHQEDSLFPAHGQLTDSDRLFILCDGMGGHDAGEVASSTVCETMSEVIMRECPDPQGPFTLNDLAAAIRAAYKALDAKDNGASKKMGTTMTLLKLCEEGAVVAHIGDSRVYHIRPGKSGADTKIMSVTEDHSLINDLVKAGEMTPEQARNSGQKNIITRAMQPGEESRCKADVFQITDIRPGDYFYLCSDGMLEQEEMDSGEALKNIFSRSVDSDAKRIEILTGATSANRDNHTAIIVHILDVYDVASKPSKGRAVAEIAGPVASNPEMIVKQPYQPYRQAMSSVSPGNNAYRNHASANKSRILWGAVLLLIIAGVFAVAWFIFLREAKQPTVTVDELVEPVSTPVRRGQQGPGNNFAEPVMEQMENNSQRPPVERLQKLKDQNGNQPSNQNNAGSPGNPNAIPNAGSSGKTDDNTVSPDASRQDGQPQGQAGQQVSVEDKIKQQMKEKGNQKDRNQQSQGSATPGGTPNSKENEKKDPQPDKPEDPDNNIV